jgi:EAL domain-containing protein (putative c-di-GMP-specific phosphodiesterase class I)
VDILKIARDFIGPADREDEWAFASAIVALGRSLGVAIIAEGIEEIGQLERLRDLGCEYGQGFLFARPGRADVIAGSLRAGLAAAEPGSEPGPRDRSAGRAAIVRGWPLTADPAPH